CETFWFLPAQTTLKILVGMLRLPAAWDADNVGLEMTMLTPNFAFREFVRSSGASIDYYFVIAYNGCCIELAQRDLDLFLEGKAGDLAPPYSVERQMMEAGAIRARMRVPDLLNDSERVLYRQSVTFLLGAQNREAGLGFGQIVSGAMPASRRWAEPIDHFFSAWALAKAGFPTRTRQALDFAFAPGRDAYRFLNVGGENYGVGFNYRVTPGKWYGSGREFKWKDAFQAPLSMLGTALGIIAYDSWLQAEQRRYEPDAIVADSILLSTDWEMLSRQVADVLLYRLENNMAPKDAGCWGKTLSPRPNVVTSLYSAAALRIASAYAALMHDDLRRYLYARGARSIITAIDSLAATLDTTSIHNLDVIQLRLFDPLLVDGISLDLFRKDSPARAFTFDALEQSFRLDDGPWYLARPDGDWYDRRAHPFITLRLATAAARAGMKDTAERLFAAVVRMAGQLYNQVPELYDPATGGAYGGIPSAGRGAAAYILAAWEMNALRLRLERRR
ncbi:MAG: hypothetical protein GXO82_08060, partial [Chlorobi bacterium]|nr:hypothetical protein [Chlorobiota bacterium]